MPDRLAQHVGDSFLLSWPQSLAWSAVSLVLEVATFLFYVCVSPLLILLRWFDKPKEEYISSKLSTRHIAGHGWTDFLTVGAPSSKLTFIMIPGNPGVVEFYEEYLETIHRESKGQIQCIAIGHLGHSKRSGVKNQGRVHTLADQVAHKLAAIEAILQQSDTPIALGGHSVGAHICLEVMRYLPQSRVLKVIGLCPTVLHIGRTPNGRRFYPALRHLRGPVSRVMAVISHAPLSLQRFLIKRHLVTADEATVAGALALLHGTVVRNIMTMAFHEMHEIADLDAAHATSLADKLVMYFVSEDAWVSRGHSTMFVAACPKSTTVMGEGVEHAFVLKSSKHVGELTWSWLEPCLTSKKSQ